MLFYSIEIINLTTFMNSISAFHTTQNTKHKHFSMDANQKMKAKKYASEERKNFKEKCLFFRSDIYLKNRHLSRYSYRVENQCEPRRSERLSKKQRVDYLK